ncbi:hypothetical protein PTKIN_Ptkin09bG0056200 [Pterospermum kingtungense]
MERTSPSPAKPILERSNISSESLQKYREEISALNQANGWNLLQLPLLSYQGFWFYPFFLRGAMYARDHFQAQPCDIFLCTPMKTGTTWLKALSFSIVTRIRFDVDSTTPLRTTLPHDCIPFLEFGEHYSTELGPRVPLFATHLPYTCLPKSILDLNCKIVYLCRDPKDTFISMWHYFRRAMESNKQEAGVEGDLVPIEEAFELFCTGISSYGPYWEHVLGYWKACLECPQKILFLKYEDMKEDTEGCVRKLGEFFGCPFSLEEEREGIIQRIIEFCSFESLSNLEVNKTGKQGRNDKFVENNSYFRKGKVGDWRNYITAEMGKRLDHIMEEKLSGSGFTFRASPHLKAQG